MPVLREAGHETVERQSNAGDVADESTWLGFPSAEAVVHLAGKSFVPDSWDDPSAYVKTNLMGTMGALAYCRRHGARLVLLSSYMYGHPTRLPIDEAAELFATNPYALSKKLAEEACTFFAENFGVNVTVLRPFNVYGPGQSERFLIPSIFRQVKEGGIIRVKDLEPRRDYIYVSDLVDAVAKAVSIQHGYRVFNIGSGVSHSVAEVLELIESICGVPLRIESEGERRKDEVMDTVADISEAGRCLGWQPRFTLRDGLDDMFRLGA